LAKQPASLKREPPDRSKRRSRKRSSALERLRGKYLELEKYDGDSLLEEGELLAGADEAGRGALAGPVVAAAVVLPRGSELVGVDDSKRIAEERREELFAVIVEKALAVGISFSHPRLIDTRNVLNASLMAMAKAVENLKMSIDLVLLDGRDGIDIPGRVVPVVKGDGKSLSIAAASIVAKVARDRLMRRLHKVHPAYNFISNKGYGTKEHIDAIIKYGMTPVHRRTYCASAVENAPRLF
jgi:ribonuclease HII